MTRKERSDLYGDMLQLLEQIYNVPFQDPEAPKSVQWKFLVDLVPKRGSLETGGNNMLAANLWRGVNVLYRDPRGRKNALMLVVRMAKLTSWLLPSNIPFLREMATALGFPLYVEEGATGAQGGVIDVTDDDGIRVGPPRVQRTRRSARSGRNVHTKLKAGGRRRTCEHKCTATTKGGDRCRNCVSKFGEGTLCWMHAKTARVD